MKERIKAALVALVLSMSLTVSAIAGPLEDGMDAYKRKDYATALQLLRPLAEQGNPDAMFQLGTMYDEGKGVPQDYVEAHKWYRKAAEKGDMGATEILGAMFESGLGVPHNYAEAQKLYRKAAQQGYAPAMESLGTMYDEGKGVPQDYVEAHKWYNLAAANYSSARQTKYRDDAVKNRDALARKMTLAQIAEAQRLAREWKPK
jgi:TPR repeat protein